MKTYLSKAILTEIRNKYLDKIQGLQGLEDVRSLRKKFEYEVVIDLINRRLAALPKGKKKKEYLQLYYQKNRDKLNKRYCDKARETREKSKLYDEIIRNGKIN